MPSMVSPSAVVVRSIRHLARPRSEGVELGRGTETLVEIARALRNRSRVLILMSRTAALTERESERCSSLCPSFDARDRASGTSGN